jgi:hypothetical protein
MEQDHVVRDQGPGEGSDFALQQRDHIMATLVCTGLVVEDFPAEEDVGLPLAVDADLDAVAGIGKLILLIRRIPLLTDRVR